MRKPGVCSIDGGGGAVVDEDSLLDSLDYDIGVAGATSDVFKVEPLPADHRFWTILRITCSFFNKMSSIQIRNIKHVFINMKQFFCINQKNQ